MEKSTDVAVQIMSRCSIVDPEFLTRRRSLQELVMSADQQRCTLFGVTAWLDKLEERKALLWQQMIPTSVTEK